MKTRILVLPGAGEANIDWPRIAGAQIAASYEELAAEFCFAMQHSRVEISLVVFERSVALRTFIDFLSRPKRDFRGDVLFIGEEDIFISSILTGDGRVLYRLSEQDLEFYLFVQLKKLSEDEGDMDARLPGHVGESPAPGTDSQWGTSPFLTFE
ncbi:MAG TPA: hypothetical protein VHL58_09840 [Thermoanaerobaculia bacterium]|nr:hypothetical protein [Thermoanaerobaculia bacterium]